MVIISKIASRKSGVEVIDVNSRYFWLNEKDIEKNRTFKFTSCYKQI